jgi:glycoside hydrolase-like protein
MYSGGLPSTRGERMEFGLDYVSGPPIAAMRQAGVTFVCRYLSYVNDQTRGKLLTRDEAQKLEAAGIALVSNYEWYGNRAVEGYNSGVQDAQIAASQHALCGGPPHRPIYFSVDVDVAGAQVADYFRGVASVIGTPRTGAYGSFRVLQYLFNAGLIAWGWQTYAWSNGAWEPRAHIQQYQNNMTFSGASVDFDRSTTSDFGQWKGGASVNVPTGWELSSDGKTLYSPNNRQGGTPVPITGSIMAYILNNSWDHANVALNVVQHVDILEYSNPSLGPGWVQDFRWSRLEVADNGSFAGKVILGWLGIEVVYVRNLCQQIQSALDATQSQVGSLKTQLGQAQAQVATEQTQITTLQAELANKPETNALANRLSSIGLLAKQAADAIAQVQQQAAQPIQ